MPGKKFESNKIYLSIIQGTLRQQVDENHEGAIKREYEKDGVKKTKWELHFKSWFGYIVDLVVKETDYGEILNIVFEDAILTVNVESKYFQDVVRKLVGANMHKEFTFSPFDWEENGKRRTGVSIEQDGEKIKSYFYNDVDKTYCNGWPKPTGDTTKFKTDDWKIFYIQVKKFLLTQVELLKEKLQETDDSEIKESEIVSETKTEDEINTELSELKEEENDNEIKLSDIPY